MGTERVEFRVASDMIMSDSTRDANLRRCTKGLYETQRKELHHDGGKKETEAKEVGNRNGGRKRSCDRSCSLYRQ